MAARRRGSDREKHDAAYHDRPITRLEGHGKIEIFLDDDGNVANTYFQIPELRGFERFCVGRPVEEMPMHHQPHLRRLPRGAPHGRGQGRRRGLPRRSAAARPRSCASCSTAPSTVTDHTTHFYALGGPDFIVGPDAPVAERNILGVIHKVGLEIGGKVIQARKYGHDVVEMIGGRKVHPCTSIPGGMTKGITEEQRAEIEKHGPLGDRVRPVQPASSSTTSCWATRPTST